VPLTASAAPDITEGLPAVIAARTLGATYSNNGLAYDLAISGLPFILAPTAQRPYMRKTADIRKQQIDTSREAGEQTLDQWWTRSQDSWHRGEGIKFYEPGSDELTANRYGHSVGVDIWTKGQVSLLKATAVNKAATAGQDCYTATAVVGGVDVYFTTINGAVSRETGAASTAFTGTGSTAPVAVAGDLLLGGITTGVVSGAVGGTALAALWTIGAGAVVTPHWAKNRIIATRGNGLWELTLAGGAMPATATYVHPVAGWTWTAVAEAPTSILAAGYVNGQGRIYEFTLETDSGTGATVPKLGQPFPVAEFPPGEEVHSLRVYLGTYVAIGTSRGLRIGRLDGNGNIAYGPLLVETTSPVRSLTARDSYIYAGIENGIDGLSGAVRVNLGDEISDLSFPWAYDAQALTTGRVQSVSFLGNSGLVVLGVLGKGAYLQSSTLYETTGYVTSGRIRYATSELKDFRRCRVSGTVLSGSKISLYVRDSADSETFLFAIASGGGLGKDIALNVAAPQSNASIRLRLEASTDKLTSPVLDALTVKALPAVVRQRLIQYPVLCFDSEADRHNNRKKIIGGASARLFALEDLESTSAVVLVKDFTCGETYEAQVESIEFVRTKAPDRVENNFGGIATITLRKLT